MVSHPPNAKYPDTIAITYNESSNQLISIYNDHSIFIWDVSDIFRVSSTNRLLINCNVEWSSKVM